MSIAAAALLTCAAALTGCQADVKVDVKPTESVSVDATATPEALAKTACEALNTFAKGDLDATAVALSNAEAAARKDVKFKALAEQVRTFDSKYFETMNEAMNGSGDGQGFGPAYRALGAAGDICTTNGVKMDLGELVEGMPSAPPVPSMSAVPVPSEPAAN